MPNPDEMKLHVEFFMDKKLNKRKSEEAGRAIHDEVEKIWIRFPGDNKNDHIAPAKSKSIKINGYEPTYAERFPDQYEAFKKGEKYRGEGTSIAVAPFLSAAKVRDLEAMNIFTIEALADLDGAFLKRLGMGARELKNQAEDYLATAKDLSAINQMTAQNKAMSDELAALKAEMEKLKAGAVSHETSEKPEASPFDDMDDDTVRLWMSEQGGSPDARWGRKRLIEEANQLNMQLKLEKDRAA